MEKIIIKFGDTEIEKQIFQQHKRPISIKNIDINKIKDVMRSLLVKRVLNISLAIKMLKLDLHLRFFQK